MDFSSVEVQEDPPEAEGDLTSLIGGEGSSPRALPPIWAEVSKSVPIICVKCCFDQINM